MSQGSRELARVVGRYARTELMVCDELGYLALPDGAAELVFQVLSERHERASLIVTTNLPFGEWTKVFPDPGAARGAARRRPPVLDRGGASEHSGASHHDAGRRAEAGLVLTTTNIASAAGISCV